MTSLSPTRAIVIQKEILCDTQTNGGGWIVIQRRTSGEEDFYRDWTSYRNGFGSPKRDFWMGNEAIHQLTNSAAYELRVDIRFKSEEFFAEYGHFRIEDEKDKYRLRIGTFAGNIKDALSYSNDQKFSTFDEDNDVHGTNCAIDAHGAWWYKTCYDANLNGQWGVPAVKGAVWGWARDKQAVSFSEMKIRRVK